MKKLKLQKTKNIKSNYLDGKTLSFKEIMTGKSSDIPKQEIKCKCGKTYTLSN